MIPLGIINASVTFQREMEITFHVMIGQSIIDYLDYLIIFSKKRSDHVHHLKQIFMWCWKYGISLNPRKSIFDVSEGILLGNIIAKSEIKIDPMRVKTIKQSLFPVNKKAISLS